MTMSKTTEQTEHNKKRVLDELEGQYGIVTTACRRANVGRTQFYHWVNTDPEFAAKVKDIKEQVIDFTENKLLKAIEEGNITAILFYLKTQGKRRGYVEGQEVINYTPDKPPVWLDGKPIKE